MAKKRSTKQAIELFRGDLYFYDTTVRVNELFDHLQGGGSVASFVAEYLAVEPSQVHEVLKRAQALLCESAGSLVTAAEPPE